MVGRERVAYQPLDPIPARGQIGDHEANPSVGMGAQVIGGPVNGRGDLGVGIRRSDQPTDAVAPGWRMGGQAIAKLFENAAIAWREGGETDQMGVSRAG